jgi:hypothetical protein
MQNVAVRDFTLADLPRVKELHERMGLDYRLPDLESPLFIIRKVVEVDGEIVAITAARVEAELYLFVDHEVADPEQRWEALKILNKAVLDEAYWEKGLNNVVLWCPVEIEKSFGKRLKELGFSRDREGFHSWSRETKTV